MSSYTLTKALGVDPPRIYEIVADERGISGDTPPRLGRYQIRLPVSSGIHSARATSREARGSCDRLTPISG